jgi:hypothetical protein
MQGTVTASWNTLGAGKIEDSRRQTTGQGTMVARKMQVQVVAVAGGYDMRDEDLEKREGNE